MRETGSIVAETASRIFTDLGDLQTLNRATDQTWKAPLWQALEEAGLTLAWVPGELGGSGADLADGFDVMRVAGRHAVPVALAETLLAGWALSSAGLASPEGPMTVAPSHPDDRIDVRADGSLAGRARAVPFAPDAGHIVAMVTRKGGGDAVALCERAALRIPLGENIAGDASATVSFDGVEPVTIKDAPVGLTRRSMLLMGAAARSVLMAGAMQSILDLAVKYSNERVAFERPIAKFQAVQHNLARLAGEVAAAAAASGSAADALARAGTPDEELFLEAASAKIRVGEAAAEGAAIAHQVHGAIGFTQEYVLHRFTRRLWAWRDDFGNESYWAVELGNMIAARGADELWPLLAAR